MNQLQETDDLTFAVAILNERRNKLNPYTPLAKKLSNAVNTINEIKNIRNKRTDFSKMSYTEICTYLENHEYVTPRYHSLKR
jgi:hypothetical protein